LGLAFLIFAAMFWTALSLLDPPDRSQRTRPAALVRFAGALVLLVLVMVLSGGLVAGARAGFAFNSFPLMNGPLVPPGVMAIDPWYLNFPHNVATVQFDHRLIAWALALLVPLFWWRVRAAPGVSRRARIGADLLLGIVAVQIGLGISTLLLAVPLRLAALHQAGAVLVFAAALNAAHALRGGAQRGA